MPHSLAHYLGGTTMPQCNILLCGHPALDAVYTVCFELVGPLHLHDAVTYSVATSATTYMLCSCTIVV